MRTIITNAKRATNTNSEIWVDYRSVIGSGTALWAGHSPTAGQEYDVELEIEGPLRWGTDIVITPADQPHVTSSESDVRIRGVVDSLGESDWAAVRLGSAILMIETEGKPFEPGTFVEVRGRKLTLHDEGT
jgi:hypothetical protein